MSDDPRVEAVARVLAARILVGPEEPENFSEYFMDTARAALSAAEKAAWRPIEEAPRDGMPVLMARVGENIGARKVEINEWCERGDEGYWNGNGHRATHFAYLLEPPEKRGR